MKRIPWRWIGLWLAFFLPALVLSAPAELVPWLLRKQPAWHLEQLDGSLWTGQAKQVHWHRPGQAPLALGAIHWHLHPWALLTGKWKLDMDLHGAGGQIMGQIEKSASGWQIRDLHIQAPVAFWAAQHPRSRPFDLSGELVGDIQTLSLSTDGIFADGQIQWRGASTSLSSENPIGDYRLELKGRRLSLDTLGGTLQLEGQGELQPDRSLQLSGSARTNRRGLDNLLALLGPDQGNGVHTFTLRLRPVN